MKLVKRKAYYSASSCFSNLSNFSAPNFASSSQRFFAKWFIRLLLFLHHVSKPFHKNGLKKEKGLNWFRIFENLLHTTCWTVSSWKHIFKTCKTLIQTNSNATSGLLVLDSAQQVACRIARWARAASYLLHRISDGKPYLRLKRLAC